MRNGEGGTVPSYNLQLLTDTTHGLVVNVEASTDAIDYRQMEPALQRCQNARGRLPQQEAVKKWENRGQENRGQARKPGTGTCEKIPNNPTAEVAGLSSLQG
jgi:hypothetical protein